MDNASIVLLLVLELHTDFSLYLTVINLWFIVFTEHIKKITAHSNCNLLHPMCKHNCLEL